MTREQIENDFSELQSQVKGYKRKDKSLREIIEWVLRNGIDSKGEKRTWWLPHHFMGVWDIAGGKYFVGYTCTQRISELAKETSKYEHRPCGKYKAIRVLTPNEMSNL